MIKYFYTSHEGGLFHMAHSRLTRHEFMRVIEELSKTDLIHAWRGRATRETPTIPSFHSILIEPGLRFDVVNQSWDSDTQNARLFKSLDATL